MGNSPACGGWGNPEAADAEGPMCLGGTKDRGKDTSRSAWALLGVRFRDCPSVFGTCMVMPTCLGALGGPSAEASPLGVQRGRK